MGVLLLLLTAVLLAPVQGAAGAAVAAALHGTSVMGWCLLLTLLTMVRGLGSWWGGVLLARDTARWGTVLVQRVGPALAADPHGDQEEVERARQQRQVALRSLAEGLGLVLGTLLTLVVVHPQVAWVWLLVVTLAALVLRAPGAAALVLREQRRGTPSDAGLRAWAAAPVVARMFGWEDRLRRADARWQARRRREVQGWRRSWARRGMAVQALLAVGHVLVTLGLVLAVAGGRLSFGAAVAGILIATTAAVRVDLWQTALRAWILHRAAHRRALRWKVALTNGVSRDLLVPGLGVVAPGTVIAWSSSTAVEAWLAHAAPVGTVILTQDPSGAAGPLVRHLDPAGRFPAARHHEILRHLELQHLIPRLDESLGAHGRGLSGGERWRVALARTLLAMPPVMVLRAPGRGLDEVALGAVARSVQAFRGTSVVLLLEADPRLLASMAVREVA